MHKAGVSHVIMEVASHALDLFRVAGIRYDVGLFTNLTQDHLDYHRTFENYFAAKKKLFTEYLTGIHLADGPRALVNTDDEWGRRLVDELGPGVVTYSLGGEADFSIHGLETGRSGFSARLRTPDNEFEIKTPLLGDVNAYNALAAAAAAGILGISAERTAAGLTSAPQTPGRLERVGGREEFLVLVDYAHTPDALARALQVARNLNPRRLISVFGCGGDRDRGKRPLMGEAAGRLSDLAVVTSDNPRTEEPLVIIEDILGGMTGLGLTRFESDGIDAEFEKGSYTVEPDRRTAIRLACRLMAPGDILVVAGKGHEDYQILGRKKIHFDDREEARAALEMEGKF
jgi:UDP-N-acetylmuramoyl-L-alanyl-D-glutamate--2,6-diaminopimelate ligase